MHDRFDFIVVGGGLFGIYAALYLARRGQSICILEREKDLLKKASIVNQARLHSGYHYPRSIATAVMSNDYKARFTADHQAFINFSFDKYYALDRFGSFTDPQQFERFCQYLDIRCERVPEHPLFNFDRLSALYATTEYTFDPVLIAEYYRRQVRSEANIKIITHCEIKAAEAAHGEWRVAVHERSGKTRWRLAAPQVINATYSGSNAVNRLFGCRDIDLMHEISEIALLTSPQLRDTGLTVMDGQFGSLMPYGLSGLLSLSSVAYTHHKVSYDNQPAFDCQAVNTDCRPDFPGNCNDCPARPRSNYRKMLRQFRQYLAPGVSLHYFQSLFTIKSKLKANYIDDGRPTEISVLNDNPRFYCIFAGKINSIYEIEKVVEF